MLLFAHTFEVVKLPAVKLKDCARRGWADIIEKTRAVIATKAKHTRLRIAGFLRSLVLGLRDIGRAIRAPYRFSARKSYGLDT